jgi:hypothetical protein
MATTSVDEPSSGLGCHGGHDSASDSFCCCGYEDEAVSRCAHGVCGGEHCWARRP